MNNKYVTEIIDELNDVACLNGDLDELVRLHIECLPTSLFSRLGVAVTRCLYRYALKSEKEIVLVVRDIDGKIVGGSVVSLSPATLVARLLSGSMVIFYLMLYFYKIPLSYSSSNQVEYEKDCPELMFLFIDEKKRSLGIGKDLVVCTHKKLSARGVNKLCVYTEDYDENRAIPFYLDRGYQQIGKGNKGGVGYLRFEKQLL